MKPTSIARLPSVPSHYNDLNASLTEAWLLLVCGATDRRAPFHTPAVASIGLDGKPRVRTVVLRHTDPTTRTIRFHTDIRTGKVQEFAANPAVQMHFYDPAQKIQLRLSGRATVHTGDAVAQRAWDASQPMSRKCYQQDAAPGSSASDPDALLIPAAHAGTQNFSAVIVEIDELEWLYLATQGHRRARFTWRDGSCAACWLAP